MTARQLAFIGSRLMAVYLFFMVLPQIVNIFHALGYLGANTEGVSMGDFWMSFLTPIALGIGIYLFWDRADWMSHRLTPAADSEDQTPFTVETGLQMGTSLLGALMLTDALGHLAVFVYKWLLAVRYPSDTAYADLGYYGVMFAANFVMAFVLIGWPGNIARLILNLRKLAHK